MRRQGFAGGLRSAIRGRLKNSRTSSRQRRAASARVPHLAAAGRAGCWRWQIAGRRIVAASVAGNGVPPRRAVLTVRSGGCVFRAGRRQGGGCARRRQAVRARVGCRSKRRFAWRDSVGKGGKSKKPSEKGSVFEPCFQTAFLIAAMRYFSTNWP